MKVKVLEKPRRKSGYLEGVLNDFIAMNVPYAQIKFDDDEYIGSGSCTSSYRTAIRRYGKDYRFETAPNPIKLSFKYHQPQQNKKSKVLLERIVCPIIMDGHSNLFQLFVLRLTYVQKLMKIHMA